MKEVMTYACRLLARREYAIEELRRKLEAKWPQGEGVEEAVDRLVKEGLVSDQRFAQSFVRSRIAKFQGPRKIRAELFRRGVSEAAICSALDAGEHSWVELATDWLARQGADLANYETRAAFYRRLANRGFTHEQAMDALDRSQRPGRVPGQGV